MTIVASPIWPNFHQRKQDSAANGIDKINANITYVRGLLAHPVEGLFHPIRMLAWPHQREGVVSSSPSAQIFSSGPSRQIVTRKEEGALATPFGALEREQKLSA